MPATDSSAPTLTNVARIGRQTIKFSIITLVVLIVGRMFLSAFISFWKAIHPEPPPPPTMGFGKLPAIVFPEQDPDQVPKSYRLELATASFPSFGDRAKVFLALKSAPSLLADQEARRVAQIYNFVFEPQVLDERTYRWTRSEPLESTFDLDIQNMHFVFKTDYLSRPDLILNKNLPDDFESVNLLKTFLRSANLLPEDVATSSGDISYLKSLGSELEEAVSLSDADFVKVDLNRYPIDGEFRMYTPGGYKGTITAIITGVLRGNDAILQMEYNYQAIDYLTVETYPLRSPQEAWKLLQAGEGFTLSDQKLEEAVIRNVYLAYFDSFVEQEYLQPIFVFEGDDAFLGYVPALDPRVVAD
ncbi:MAG: hypothetical protein PVJ09_03630 [Candidatus Woesebacteria bacterium]|jgi:hypothetical protein